MSKELIIIGGHFKT